MAYFSHCHKRQKDSLETRAVSNLPSTPKHRSLLKYMPISEWNQLFAGNFHAVRKKINADMFHFTKKWNWEWIA